MADARRLYEIARAVRALQIQAVGAESPEADALLAITSAAVHEMAVVAERGQRPQARTVKEMMRRLKSGRG
jgi:hypothetical protein